MAEAIRFSFSHNPDLRKVLLDWWQRLDQSRGDRADLRRATTPTEVAFCSAFHRLFNSLRVIASVSPASLAVVAGVLAHVKSPDMTVTFATQMAAPKSGSDRARVSGLRFRRLLKIKERDELHQPLIRVVRLLGGEANILNLADDVYFWGDNVRKNWAYAYYEKAPSEE